MPAGSADHGGASGHRRPGDADLRSLVDRMTCACADRAALRDAPLARAMFHLVESDRRSLEAAARALGIAAGDGAYLLAGLRRDLAGDLVEVLRAGRVPGGARRSGGRIP